MNDAKARAQTKTSTSTRGLLKTCRLRVDFFAFDLLLEKLDVDGVAKVATVFDLAARWVQVSANIRHGK